MSELQSVWSFFIESVFPHWPGFSFIVVIAIIAQNLKFRIFTAEMAKNFPVVYWLRRIFPIILLLLGIIPGMLWEGEVIEGIDTTSEKVFYFIGCSGVSVIGFNVFKQWVKKKYDIELTTD